MGETNRERIRIAFFICLWSSIFGLPKASVSEEDYFDYITIFSGGRIARFTEMPIRVYVSSMLRTDAYLNAIRYGMRQWESASGGSIQFEETQANGDADIRVSWGRAGLWPIAEVTGAKAELTRLDGDGIRVEIILVPHEPELGVVSDPARLRAICLHEFGHAVGLWGHSPDSRDAEFHTSTKEQPSPHDINTLLRVYATPQSTPQHEIAIKTIKESLDGSAADARRHYLLGTITVDKGNIREAIGHFKTALALNPTSEPARQKLIQVYQNFGHYERAIELLHDVLAEAPSHDAYNTLGVMYYRNGKIDESIAAFQDSINQNSHDLAAQHNLHQIFREKGISALQTENYAQANVYFEKALRYAARDASAVYRLMGDSYERRGDFATAILQYQKALEANPVDRKIQDALAQCHNNHGVELRRAKRWDDAINAYNRALALAPTLTIVRSNIIDALLQRAKHHRELGNIDETIASYSELAALESGNSDAHSRLGELYLDQNAYTQAIESFQSAYELKPNVSQTRHNLVVAYSTYAKYLDTQNRHDEAINQLQQALAVTPTQDNLHVSLARVYQRTGNLDRAQAAFTSALRIHPNNDSVRRESIYLRTIRANKLLNARRYSAALTEFEAIPRDERSVDIHNSIGYLYLIRRNFAEAISAFESALAIAPTNPIAYQNLLATESQLIRQPPHRLIQGEIENLLARAQNQLAMCYLNQGEYDNAMAKYRAAMNLSPTDAEVRRGLKTTGQGLAQVLGQSALEVE